MTIQGFIILAIIFIAILFAYSYADRIIKRLPAQTVKNINWVGFILAVAGGILWYFYKKPLFMFITLLGVIIYFLFYNYDKMEES